MNITHCFLAVCLGILLAAALPAAPPFPGTKPAGETRSEKFLLPLKLQQADLAGEGAGVQAKIILPARMRGLPPPAGAPAKVGATLIAPPRSIAAIFSLAVAAVCVLCFVRGQPKHLTTQMAVLGMAVFAAAYGTVQAQAPAVNLKQDPKHETKDKIVVEFSVDVEEAVLILPAK